MVVAKFEETACNISINFIWRECHVELELFVKGIDTRILGIK